MIQTDAIQTFTLKNLPICGAIVRLESSLQTVTMCHPYPKAVNQLLAETLISMLLITSKIKWDGRFVLQFQGKGPINTLIAKMNHKREISAMARWQSPLPSSTNKLLEKGQLQSSLICRNKDIQTSIIPINPNGIKASLEDYFTYSEQLPSKIWLHANHKSAQGLLLQAMPNNDELFSFSNWINKLNPDHIDLELDNMALIKKLMSQHDCQVHQEKPILFNCECTHKKMEQALISMGKAAIRDEMSHKDNIEICCEFCNKKISFNQNDIDKLLGPI